MHDKNDTKTKKKIRLPSIATLVQSLSRAITRPSQDSVSGYEDDLSVPDIAPGTLMTIQRHSNRSDTSAPQHSPRTADATVSSAHRRSNQSHLHHSLSFPPLILNYDEVDISPMPNPKIVCHYPQQHQHQHHRQLDHFPHESTAIKLTGNVPLVMSANNYHEYHFKHVKTPHYHSRSIKQKLHCQRCGITDTPAWRRGPNGARTLCNACGIFHAKILKRDGPAAAAALNGKKITKNNSTKKTPLGTSGTPQISALVPEGRYYHAVQGSYGIDHRQNSSAVSPSGYALTCHLER